MTQEGDGHGPGREELLGAEDVPGDSTGVACPLCGGVLWQPEEGEQLRCRIGHCLDSLEDLEKAQTTQIENLLWSAERALRERAVVLRRLAHRSSPDSYSGRTFQREAEAATANAEDLRRLLERGAAARAQPAEEPAEQGR